MTAASGRESFPVTKMTIDQLDIWVGELAAPLLPAVRVKSERSFRWRFRDETPYVLLVAKAVRIASGIRASMLLAEIGFVQEAASLVRIVSDFATEAFAVAEGELRGQRTKAQKEFVSQFFERKLLKNEPGAKTRYVGREDLMKAHVRLGDDAGIDGEVTRDLMRSLNDIYDGYVHGAYSTAMELYHGGRHEFMLRGHESIERRRVVQTAISGKLLEVVRVFGLIALVAGNATLHTATHETAKDLEASGEQDLSEGDA